MKRQFKHAVFVLCVVSLVSTYGCKKKTSQAPLNSVGVDLTAENDAQLSGVFTDAAAIKLAFDDTVNAYQIDVPTAAIQTLARDPANSPAALEITVWEINADDLHEVLRVGGMKSRLRAGLLEKASLPPRGTLSIRTTLSPDTPPTAYLGVLIGPLYDASGIVLDRWQKTKSPLAAIEIASVGKAAPEVIAP